jgi:hypothetical protein
MTRKGTKPARPAATSNSKKVLEDIVTKINGRTRSHYIDTGRDLIRASEILSHGKFGLWLKENFGWSPSTARNFMNAAKLVDKNAKFADLQPSAVMALSAPSVESPVLDAVLAALASGGRPNVAEIKKWIRAARPAKASPSPKPASIDQDDSFRQLVQLLKVVGAQKADDALREAFQGAALGGPSAVPANNVEAQSAARGVVLDPPASPADDEIKDLDFSAMNLREAA